MKAMTDLSLSLSLPPFAISPALGTEQENSMSDTKSSESRQILRFLRDPKCQSQV